MSLEKAFLWLIETPAGAYRSLTDEAPLPEYDDQLGSGQSNMHITLPRKWGQIGVPGDAASSADIVLTPTGASSVSIYVIDATTLALGGGTIWGDWTWGTSIWGDPPAGLGQLLYQGVIEETEPTVGASEDYLSVTLLPAHSITAEYFDGVATFTDADPVDVARHFFDGGYLPTLTWDSRNPTHSGRQITQTFQYQTYRSILDFCTQAAGSTWHNHVDERNRFRMWAPDVEAAPDHVVQVGRELVSAKYLQTRVAQKNQVILRGKDGIVSNQKSSDWMRSNARSVVENSPDITDQPTLDLIASLLLERLNILAVRATITLVSNSGALAATSISYDRGLHTYPSGQLAASSAPGYLLESVRPGDTVQLNLDQGDALQFVWGAATWGTSYWAGSQLDLVQKPQVISAVHYHGGDTLDIDLTTPQPAIRAAHTKVAALAEAALGASVL